MNKALITNIVLVGTGVSVGYLAGALVTKKVLEKKFKADLQEEIDSVRQHERDKTRLLQKTGMETVDKAFEKLRGEDLSNKPEVLTEEEAERFNADGEEYARQLNEQGYSTQETHEILHAVQERTTISVFEADQPSAAELEDGALHGKHIDGQPYVISIGEFMDNDEYEKIVLTYWEEDDVLMSDDDEKVIHDIDGTVGIPNLSRFGQGNDDADTVYVKNEDKKTAFEIVRDQRAYTEVILGLKEPAEPRPIRRMRDE